MVKVNVNSWNQENQSKCNEMLVQQDVSSLLHLPFYFSLTVVVLFCSKIK